MHDAIENRLNIDNLINFIKEDGKIYASTYRNYVTKKNSPVTNKSNQTSNQQEKTQSVHQSPTTTKTKIVD